MAKSVILPFVVLNFLALGSCTHVEFADCGSTAKINFVDVSPCAAEPCQLKKGTNESIEIQFIPNGIVCMQNKCVTHKCFTYWGGDRRKCSNITAGKTIIHGIIEGVEVPFPVDKPDVCKEHGITCPMPAEKSQTFKAMLPVKSEYPAVKLVVKWELHDQDDKEVYCWELPIQIVSGEEKSENV